MRTARTLPSVLSALLIVMVVAAGCSNGGNASSETTELRLGYLPNLTHAAAIAGVEKGLFAGELGADISLKTSTFNAGPAAVEALLSGAVDAVYLGPSPAINAFSKSKGAVHIISGATAGGAALVVKRSINSATDLKGKRIATPQLGNTQDVALRTWLKANGFKTNAQGGGDVKVVPQENAQTLQTFQTGDIDGAWVPEPWSTRLVEEGGGKVLFDERNAWPAGQFATTVLVVRTAFERDHPDAVTRLLKGHIAATDFVNTNVAEAQMTVNAGIEKLTGKKLSSDIITKAWKSLTFTNNPIESSLTTGAAHASDLDLLDKVDLKGITELRPLNEILVGASRPAVPTP